MKQVLSLEWKREEVMGGVTVVTDDEHSWQNEAGSLFQRLEMHTGMSNL